MSHGFLRDFEAAVRESGLEWTVLRPGGFASNAYLWAEQVRTARTIASPFADVALPVVDPADIAEVAAAALRDPAHAGRTYVLTGPAGVSPREQARDLAEAVGEPVEFVAQSAAEARARLVRFLPADAVDGMLAVMGEPSAEEQHVSPDVERVLGRAPRPFSAWAERNVRLRLRLRRGGAAPGAGAAASAGAGSCASCGRRSPAPPCGRARASGPPLVLRRGYRSVLLIPVLLIRPLVKRLIRP